MNRRKVFGLVPARSGSKGLVHKNLKTLGGKSLIQHAVEFGKKCDFIDEVFITTDSRSYELHGLQHGASSLGLRSKINSDDRTRMYDVIIEFIKKCGLDEDYVIVLLQPTSPFRYTSDMISVKNAVLDSEDSVSWFSARKVEEPHPFKLFSIGNSGKVHPLRDFHSLSSPRQALEEFYMFDGAYYIFSKNYLFKNKTLITENSRAFKSENMRVNIDSNVDYELAKFLWDDEKC